MATYWDNSCSFGLRYFSWYKYLNVHLVFSHFGFLEWESLSYCTNPGRCLLALLFVLPKLQNMFLVLVWELLSIYTFISI